MQSKRVAIGESMSLITLANNREVFRNYKAVLRANHFKSIHIFMIGKFETIFQRSKHHLLLPINMMTMFEFECCRASSNQLVR